VEIYAAHGIMAIWPVIRMLMIFYSIQETPYFWISKSNIEEARELTEEIYKAKWVEFELEKAIEHYRSEQTSASMIVELNHPIKRKMCLIGVYLFFVQQLAGVNIVNFYSHEIFISAGLSEATASLFTFLIGIIDI
jgi:facilitated trehalose transporter